MPAIHIRNARVHNLQGIDLELPHNRLIVVTGVSGSGKSSLAFDLLYREGARRYLETFSAFARQHLGKLERPAVERISGLPPVLAVSQLTHGAGARSTVGTLCEVNDLLRLLFARAGTWTCPACAAAARAPFPEACPGCARPLPRIDRSLFSFNTPRGACPACNGLGTEDSVDPELLVADPQKTLREGALVPTLKRGYIVYSQVTMEVLDDVCRAHGFSVDEPWEALTQEHKDVIFFGSTRLKVPYGKHTLESRLRWTGLTAKPREEGYYKGLVPVIAETLKRNRNPNILRFVRTQPCSACLGGRLHPDALTVSVGGRTLPELAARPLDSVGEDLEESGWPEALRPVVRPILESLRARVGLLCELGLGYLTLDRAANSLAPGERQRIRLVTQALGGLRGVLYVLDEPSVGLHPEDTHKLLALLRRLRDAGNTVLVVEHDPAIIAAADYLVELGPGAGPDGGRIMYAGPRRDSAGDGTNGVGTNGVGTEVPPTESGAGAGGLQVVGVRHHNLRDVDVALSLGALNAVSGVSGAGKSSLVFGVLVPALQARLNGNRTEKRCRALHGADAIRRVVVVDNAPIGRTPRSNAATYTGLWDDVRKLYAGLPGAQERGFGAGRFSFNTKGGRCEACQGAGVQSVGMHFLGDLEVVCPECSGRRFDPETLAVTRQGHHVADLLEMTVDQALPLFAEHPRIHAVLAALHDVGLGYVPLGQPSTTLSGGEAQRVKLAADLARPSRHHTLYVLAEPTTGLHARDVTRLLAVLRRLVASGHTVLAVEQDLQFLAAVDHLVDLGPGRGAAGGRIVAVGTPAHVAATPGSVTGRHLASPAQLEAVPAKAPVPAPQEIRLARVRTHNLRGIDVRIPVGALCAVTGPSGSGKSSLAFDTLFAEGQRRFAEGLSAYARRHLGRLRRPDVERVEGLSPTVAVDQHSISANPRSTVATVTELHDQLRLLWSRAGKPAGLSAAHFSFNSQVGACPECGGLGHVLTADPDALVSDPGRSLLDGAMAGHRTGRFYGDAGNRYVHILQAAGEALGHDFTRPWQELSDEARTIAMFGAGEREFHACWQFDRKGRKGVHEWTAPWPGFVHYVDDEYRRVHADRRGEKMRALLREEACRGCDGERLQAAARRVRVAGRRLPEVLGLSVSRALDFFVEDAAGALGRGPAAVWRRLVPDIRHRLEVLRRLGLGYLRLDRATPTLSGGEARRVRLATQLGGRLFGVTYVLDEPTVGLHPRDTQRLLQVLADLRDEGNTVVVVEHDPEVIRAADWWVRLGPGGGREGGALLHCGPPDSGSMPAEPAPQGPAAPAAPGERLRVMGAHRHNLRDIDVAFVPGALNVVTGVSGSGKSTLVFEVLESTLRTGRPHGCTAVHVPRPYAAVHRLDSRAPGRTPLSTPASQLGLLDSLRKRFAAASLGNDLSAAHFSYASSKGRCPACKGVGYEQVAMDFMADVWVPCAACDGQRYRPEVLAVRLSGRTIAQVLDLTVAEAAEFFADDREIRAVLDSLSDLGLGYLPLGQPANTLSGGELQRLKLASHLVSRPSSPPASGLQPPACLFLLDEPSRGQDSSDVARLLRVLHGLVAAGHTVIAVEHNVQVMRAAQHIVDLGSEGGDNGGALVVQGTPAEVAADPHSHTAQFLRA